MTGNEIVNGTPIRCYELTGDKRLSWDNYTVVYMSTKGQAVVNNSDLYECVGLSGHAAAMVGRHLGKRIAFDVLPQVLKNAVLADTQEIFENTAK